jgi:hypothetical protein
MARPQARGGTSAGPASRAGRGSRTPSTAGGRRGRRRLALRRGAAARRGCTARATSSGRTATGPAAAGSGGTAPGAEGRRRRVAGSPWRGERPGAQGVLQVQGEHRPGERCQDIAVGLDPLLGAVAGFREGKRQLGNGADPDSPRAEPVSHIVHQLVSVARYQHPRPRRHPDGPGAADGVGEPLGEPLVHAGQLAEVGRHDVLVGGAHWLRRAGGMPLAFGVPGPGEAQEAAGAFPVGL